MSPLDEPVFEDSAIEEPEDFIVPYSEINPMQWNLPHSYDEMQGDETLKRSFQAFWQRESFAGAYQQKSEMDIYQASTKEEEMAWEDGSWNPFDALLPNSPLHDDRYAGQVAQIKNPRELALFEGRAIKEARNTSIVYNMSLGKSAVLGVAVGLTDPVTLPLLFYAPAVRGAALGVRVAKLGAYGGADQGLREALIAPNQLDRPWQESLTNVTVAALLSGAVGGAIGAKFRPEVKQRTAKTYNDILLGEENFTASWGENAPKYVYTANQDIPTYVRPDDPVKRDGTMGMFTPANQVIRYKDMADIVTPDPAKMDDLKQTIDENEAAFKDKAIDQDEYLRNKQIYEAEETKLQKEALVLKNEGFIKKITLGGRVTSQQRLAMSSSPFVRAFASHALELPYQHKYFSHSDLGGHAALTEQFKGHLNTSYYLRDVYVKNLDKYGKMEGQPMIKRWLGKAFGNEEFNKRVRQSMYSGDQDVEGNQLFTDVAQGMRKVIDRVTKDLVKLDLIPATNSTREESWFPIVFDQRRIGGNEVKFGNDMAQGWRVRAAEDTEIIAKRQKEMELESPALLKEARDEWNKVESAKDKPRIEKQKKALDKEAESAHKKRLAAIKKTKYKGKQRENYIARETKKADERLTNAKAENVEKIKAFQKAVNKERGLRRKVFVQKFNEDRTATIAKTIDAEKKDTLMFMNDMDDLELNKMGFQMAKYISELGRHESVIEMDLVEAMTNNIDMPFHANPSFTKKRTLNVPQRYLDEWTMSDIVTALDTFSRRAHGANALKRRFGTVDVEQVLNGVRKDFSKLMSDPRISKKERDALDAEYAANKKLIKHVWTGLLGKNPDYSGVSRTTRDIITAIRGLETTQHLGLSGLSAIEDIAVMPLHLGIRPIYSALMDFVQNADIHKMTKDTMQDVSVATEAAMADMSLSRYAGEALPTSADWATKTHVAVTYYLKSTLMPAVDRVTKKMVAYVMLSRLARSAIQGTEMMPFEKDLLRKFGMTDESMDRAAAQMKKYASRPGDDQNGYLHNPDLWDDQEVQVELDMAVSRASRQIISTPNIGNQNMVMSHAVYGTMLQFKSHMIGTTDNHAIPIIQQVASGTAAERLNIMLWATMGFSLASLNYNVRAAMSGREADNSTTNLVRQFVTRTGGGGVWSMAMGITDESLGISRAISGDETQFRTRSVWDGIFGPAPGTLDDALTTASMIPSWLSGEGVSRSQVAGAVRMVPFQNHWAAIKPVKAGLSRLQDAVSDE